MKKHKFITIFFLITLGSVLGFYIIRNIGGHYSSERRAWKNTAISAIESDLKDPSIYLVENGKLSRPESEIHSNDGPWLTSKAIAFSDNSWMVYRQQCRKENAKIFDIFIGRGSDGKWYYTDDHLCIGAVVLRMRGQMESIAEFQRLSRLEEFDGKSDDALKSTRDYW